MVNLEGRSKWDKPRNAALEVVDGRVYVYITAPAEDRPSGHLETSEIFLDPDELIRGLVDLGVLVPQQSYVVARPRT